MRLLVLPHKLLQRLKSHGDELVVRQQHLNESECTHQVMREVLSRLNI